MNRVLLDQLLRQGRLLVGGVYILGAMLGMLATTLFILVTRAEQPAAASVSPGYLSPQVVDLISSVGFPITLVLLLVAAGWRILRATAPVARRVVDQHLEALEEQQQQQARIVAAIEQQTSLLHGLHATNRSLAHLAEAAQRALDDDRDSAQLALSRMRDILS